MKWSWRQSFAFQQTSVWKSLEVVCSTMSHQIKRKADFESQMFNLRWFRYWTSSGSPTNAGCRMNASKSSVSSTMYISEAFFTLHPPASYLNLDVVLKKKPSEKKRGFVFWCLAQSRMGPQFQLIIPHLLTSHRPTVDINTHGIGVTPPAFLKVGKVIASTIA